MPGAAVSGTRGVGLSLGVLARVVARRGLFLAMAVTYAANSIAFVAPTLAGWPRWLASVRLVAGDRVANHPLDIARHP